METKTKTVSLEQVDEAVEDRRTRIDIEFDSDLIIDHVADAILIIDSMGAIRKINKQTESLFNYSQDELIGQKVEQLIPERFHHEHVNNRKTYISNPHIRTMGMGMDLSARRKDGTEFPCEASLGPITISNEQYTICTLRDTTEFKKIKLATIESEKRFKLLVNSSPYCIHEIDLDGRLISMNQAGLEMMGLNDFCEIKNSLYSNIVCKDDHERINKQMTLAFRGNKSEFEFTSKDGSIFQSYFVPIINNADVVTHLMGITQDVTKRKQAEILLLKSEERNRLLLDSTAEAIYGLDHNGDCTFCNPACLSMLGYENHDDMIGKNVHEMIHHTRVDGSPYPVEDCQIYKAFVNNTKCHVDTEVFFRKDGSSFPSEYWSHPIKSEGETIGCVVTFLNITERKQAEEEVRKQNENMAHLVRVQALEAMAAGIAHEINQPLAAINSYAEASRRHLQSEKVKIDKVEELAGKISNQARRAGSVVSRLRSMMQNKISKPVALDINILVGEAAEIAVIGAKDNDCNLIFNYSSSLPRVICDGVQIQQVTLNLISNAIEAMDNIADDEEKNINVETRIKDDDYVEVCISDNGSGINDLDADNIFEAFYTTKESGLGMGLSICKSIIEDHGGRLEYSQNKTGGSKFYFSLPVEK